MDTHGNSGYRVKNLRGTSGCPHKRGYEADLYSEVKCAVNGCEDYARRACHVISANQNGYAMRKLVYMCATHNALYFVFTIRLNAKTIYLEDCECGFWEPEY